MSIVFRAALKKVSNFQRTAQIVPAKQLDSAQKCAEISPIFRIFLAALPN